ncbi:MAG: hypothetical protein D6791_17975 [Chloroflexi bacterium]|nr:MAG: hypothetical protein D6791_17975 [Chloroflexota bacterium]
MGSHSALATTPAGEAEGRQTWNGMLYVPHTGCRWGDRPLVAAGNSDLLWSNFVLSAVATILIPVNANGVCGLLNLLRLDAGTLAECGQEQIRCFLEGVIAVPSGKKQELPHPAYQVRLMLG